LVESFLIFWQLTTITNKTDSNSSICKFTFH